jgi:hypothetical protein
MRTFHIPSKEADSFLFIEDGKPVIKVVELDKMAQDGCDVTGFSFQAFANADVDFEFYLANIKTVPWDTDSAVECKSITKAEVKANETFWSEGPFTEAARYLIVKIIPSAVKPTVIKAGLTFSNNVVDAPSETEAEPSH